MINNFLCVKIFYDTSWMSTSKVYIKFLYSLFYCSPFFPMRRSFSRELTSHACIHNKARNSSPVDRDTLGAGGEALLTHQATPAFRCWIGASMTYRWSHLQSCSMTYMQVACVAEGALCDEVTKKSWSCLQRVKRNL